MAFSVLSDEKIRAVVEQYSDMILRIAWQNLGRRMDAEDVMQDVFVRLMAQNEFEGEEHLKAWLIRVTINLCKDIQKSAWKRTTVPFCGEWPAMAPRQSNVMEEVFKLSCSDRNIIYLYYYEGYTIAEIAKLLGENANTVGSRLARARRKLKDILSEGGDLGA